MESCRVLQAEDVEVPHKSNTVIVEEKLRNARAPDDCLKEADVVRHWSSQISDQVSELNHDAAKKIVLKRYLSKCTMFKIKM